MKDVKELGLWFRREEGKSQSLLKMQQELEDKTYRLSVFQEFCRTVVSVSAQEVKSLLVSSVGIITHSEDVSLALADKGVLSLDMVQGNVNQEKYGALYQDTPIWQSFLTGRPYWGAFIGEISVSSVYPLVTKEGIIGVLSLHTIKGQSSGGDERNYLEALVSLAAVALQQAIQYEQTQERAEMYHDKAVRDGMTGLYNRHFLTEYGNKEITRVSRNELPLSFIMFDVDHFKNCNDTFGHSFGDLVLKEIAKLTLEGLRGEDLAFRYGGEEFIIILGGSNSLDGAKVANRLRVSIEQYAFKTEAGVETKVTVSLGVAQWQEGETLEMVIDRADRALYRAKHEGRNRVRQWEMEKVKEAKGGNETWERTKI